MDPCPRRHHHGAGRPVARKRAGRALPLPSVIAPRGAVGQRVRGRRPDAAVNGDLQGQGVVVARGLTEGAGGQGEPGGVSELQADVTTWDAALELVRGPLGDQVGADRLLAAGAGSDP
jgi:hypothetical protein